MTMYILLNSKLKIENQEPFHFTYRFCSLQMHKVLIPFFLALAVQPSTHSLEGTLLVSPFFLKVLNIYQETGNTCILFTSVVLDSLWFKSVFHHHFCHHKIKSMQCN